MKRILLILGLAAALALAAVVSAQAAKSTRSQAVVPSQGQSYGEWGAKWWKWALSIPASSNPIFDQTGANCAEGQTAGVWFLAGTGGGSVVRSCTIPAETRIFFPIYNTENDYPCPDPSFEPAPGQSLNDFLTEGAVASINRVTELEAEVDGVAIPNLFDYRGTSNMFTFTGDPSLTATFDDCITGSPQKAVSDGYWLMLEPLAPGAHTLHFRGKKVSASGRVRQVEVTYDLTVL